MNYTFRVGGLKRVGDLNSQRQLLVDVERASTYSIRKRFTVKQLHNDEMVGFVLLDPVDSAYIRVIERRGGPRFALKTLAGLRILSQFFRKEFEGHPAAKPLVFGLVNHAHPATTQLFRDAVMRNGEPNHVAAMLGLGEVQVNFADEQAGFGVGTRTQSCAEA